MDVLVTIPHYFFAEKVGAARSNEPDLYSSTNAARREDRKKAVERVILAWRQGLGGYRTLFDPSAKNYKVVSGPNYNIRIVVLTTAGRHLLDSDFVRRNAVEVIDFKLDDPRFLGFESVAVFADHIDDYDIFVYSEDDLLVSDQHFLEKCRWFVERQGPRRLLMPNRYEWNDRRSIQKVYIDGDLGQAFADRVGSMLSDVPRIVQACFGSDVSFERARNPHSGMHLLTREQVKIWREQPYWLKKEVAFVGPLESAATLGVLRTFPIYKSSGPSLDFFSVEHLDTRWSSMYAADDQDGAPTSPVPKASAPAGIVGRQPASSTRAVEPIPLHIHLAAMSPQFMDVRTHLPLRAMGRLPGVTVTLSDKQILVPKLPVQQPKVVVVQRMAVGDLDAWKAGVRTLVEKGWIVVGELDDHPDLIAAVHGRAPDPSIWRPIRLAHAAQTSTVELAEAFRAHNPNVAAFSNAAFRLAPVPPRDRVDGKPTRVFFGALNRERFSSRIGAVLAQAVVHRPEARFVVVHDRAFFEALGPVDKEFHSALPYDLYLALMETCDIALMPLEGSPGEMFKSDVKFVEASSLGLATLASPVVYGRTILDGVTGVIVPEVDDWGASLNAMLADPARRRRIASAAHDYVLRCRLSSAQAQDRLAWYRGLWERRAALTRGLSSRLNAAT